MVVQEIWTTSCPSWALPCTTGYFPLWQEMCASCLGLCYQMYREIRENIKSPEVQSLVWRISAVQERIKASQTDLGVASHMEGKAGSRHGGASKNWQRHCTKSSSLVRYGSWISSWIWELWNITEIFSLGCFKSLFYTWKYIYYN